MPVITHSPILWLIDKFVARGLHMLTENVVYSSEALLFKKGLTIRFLKGKLIFMRDSVGLF